MSWDITEDTTAYEQALAGEKKTTPDKASTEQAVENPRQAAWANEQSRLLAEDEAGPSLSSPQPHTDSGISPVVERILATLSDQQRQQGRILEMLVRERVESTSSTSPPASSDQDGSALIKSLKAIDPLVNDRRNPNRRQINAQFTPEAKKALDELQRLIGARTRAATLEYAVQVALIIARYNSKS